VTLTVCEPRAVLPRPLPLIAWDEKATVALPLSAPAAPVFRLTPMALLLAPWARPVTDPVVFTAPVVPVTAAPRVSVKPPVLGAVLVTFTVVPSTPPVWILPRLIGVERVLAEASW